MAFYTLRSILPVHRVIIIQLSSTGISCAIGTHKNATYSIELIQHTPLNYYEATTTHLANLTILLKLTHEFAIHNSVPEQMPIICFSTLQPPPPKVHFGIIQILLFLSRIGGPVQALYQGILLQPDTNANTKITIEHPAPNLISMISSPAIDSWQRRLILCIGIITVCMTSWIGYGIHLAYTVRLTLNEEKKLATYLNQLQPRVHKAKKLEKRISVLHDHISTLKELTKEEELPASICIAIANTIPNNTWLKRIAIGGKADTKDHFETIIQNPKAYLEADPSAKIPLTIQGKTMAPDEIGSFLEALSETITNATFSIERISKEHPITKAQHKASQDKSFMPYFFSIAGTIDE